LTIAAAIGAARLTGNPIEYGDGFVRGFSGSTGIGTYTPDDLARHLRLSAGSRSLDAAVRQVLAETVFATDSWYGEDVPFDEEDDSFDPPTIGS
jgi:hypothetical protein